jgi:hypothetical protein
MNVERLLEKTRYKFISECGKYIYHFSIIDYLQEYNTDKQLENHFKTHILQKNAKLISAVEPEFYQARFMDFMQNCVLINQNSSQWYKSQALQTTTMRMSKRG